MSHHPSCMAFVTHLLHSLPHIAILLHQTRDCSLYLFRRYYLHGTIVAPIVPYLYG
ncbi:hypothetical protein YC2023_054708 [Brassica napus]